MRKILLVAVACTIALASVTLLLILILQRETQGWSWWEDPWAQHENLGTGPIAYTYFPMNENNLEWIIPLGKVGIPGHPIPTDHIYYRGVGVSDTDWGTIPGPYEIRAPADGVICQIQHFKSSELISGREFDDYHIFILHTNTFQTFLGHVYDLDEHIIQQAGELKIGDNPVWIPVKAGEVIGRATGGDMGTYNKEANLNFIRPERYEPIMRYAVCPLEYFENSLKERLYQKVQRTGEPRGGKIDYDQPGKLIGNWFLEGSPTLLMDMGYGAQLSFAYSVYDASELQIGFSYGLGVPENLLAVEYTVEGPDPAEVSVASGAVVYHLLGYGAKGEAKLTILVEMVEDNRIEIETFEEWVNNPSFTSNAKYYTR